jgi:alkylated DNA repair dioxygenase AlkB
MTKLLFIFLILKSLLLLQKLTVRTMERDEKSNKTDATAELDDDSDDVFGVIRRLHIQEEANKKTTSWSAPEDFRFPEKPSTEEPYAEDVPAVFNLHRGGCIKVFRNFVPPWRLEKIRHEVLGTKTVRGYFRRYKNRGCREPRVQFLLHDEATQDFELEQPGYRYNLNTMKSRPLKNVGWLNDLDFDTKRIVPEADWNIGVNVVLYRDGKDKMGDHADNDQGEELILCVVIASPGAKTSQMRRVCVRPFHKWAAKEGDEDIELHLSPGDAYLMDGEMQKFYSHCVPPNMTKIAAPSKATTASSTVQEEEQESNGTIMEAEEEKYEEREDDGPTLNESRLVVVFRQGKLLKFPKDTGNECKNLAPDGMVSYSFGTLEGKLLEGHQYTRDELENKRAHQSVQRGVSGRKDVGCDAIIVSGLREDKRGDDQFIRLTYAVESCKGGGSMETSFNKQLPIRVFRSTQYNSRYGAVFPKKKKNEKQPRNLYRYDGVYYIESFEPPDPGGRVPYMFHLIRLRTNKIPNRRYLQECEYLGTIHGSDFIPKDKKKEAALLSPPKKKRKVVTGEKDHCVGGTGSRKNHARKCRSEANYLDCDYYMGDDYV